MEYGALCLIPPLAMFIFAVATKKSFESLVLGTLVACLITDGANFIPAWCKILLDECTNQDNAYVLLVCGMFGGLIFLLTEVKGTMGFANFVMKYCKSERSTLLASFVLGVAIFVDDYLNIMTIGTCMKNVCDKRKVPRQALAYVIDSTGAPVCALLPISTWAVFYSGILSEEPAIVAMNFSSGMEAYMHAMPYVFYPMAALLVVFLFCLGVIPKIGAMKTAYESQHALESEVSDADDEIDGGVAGAMVEMVADAETKMAGAPEKPKPNVWDFVIPMGALIGITVVTADMLIAVVFTLAICFFLYTSRGKMNLTRYFELFWLGFEDMMPVLGITLAAFMLRRACGNMELPQYVISLAQPFLNAQVMAAVIFVIVSLLTFVTASFFGIESIAIAIVVPMAVSLGCDVMLVVGAVISGGVFGSHACFYADATVLTSSSCNISNISHAVTQFPYAIIGAVLATAAFLAAGYTM